ncbi:MAG: hypothetical protein ACP5F3_00315 [Candidatus Syntrophosphaera sp.]
MKRTILFAAILLLTLGLWAQTAREEALESLDNAKAMIAEDSFTEAMDEINYATAKISEIQAEELIKFIPDAPEGFTLEEKESQSMGQAGAMMGSANAIIANASYSMDDSEIEITITVGGLMGKTGGMMGMASMFGGTAMGTKTVRVSGYTGNQEYDKGDDSGTLTVQVGDNITVIVEGDEIEDAEILKDFAELIDLPLLERSF